MSRPSTGGGAVALTLNGRQPLFNRANDASISQAEKALEVAQADLQTAEHELIVRTAQTYFDVLVAQDSLEGGLFNTLAGRLDVPRGLAGPDDSAGGHFLHGDRLADWLKAVAAAVQAALPGGR